ncbi:MAG: FAD-dependent oxidoreductase [Chromatiales bacterium]|nr:FAD-dependent oxidoreductase [Chromatiales bacterium]
MAHYAAAAGLNALVLEQDSRVGGCLHSHRFSGALDGFWLELGAHSCFNSYSNLLAILEQIGVLNRVQSRVKVGFRMFADGAVRSIPLPVVLAGTGCWRRFGCSDCSRSGAASPSTTATSSAGATTRQCSNRPSTR